MLFTEHEEILYYTYVAAKKHTVSKYCNDVYLFIFYYFRWSIYCKYTSLDDKERTNNNLLSEYAPSP